MVAQVTVMASSVLRCFSLVRAFHGVVRILAGAKALSPGIRWGSNAAGRVEEGAQQKATERRMGKYAIAGPCG